MRTPRSTRAAELRKAITAPGLRLEESLEHSPKAQALRLSEGEARLSKDFRSKQREPRGPAFKLSMPR